jgi:hypothetical protein
MRRTFIKVTSVGLVVMLTGVSVPAASAAVPSCAKGTKVQVVKGKATMVLKGKRIACKVVKATPKPTQTLAISPIPEVRITNGAMNDLVMKGNLTVTVRNYDTATRTLVLKQNGAELGYLPVVVEPNSGMGAFLTPSKPGVYEITLVEVPTAKGRLTVVP